MKHYSPAEANLALSKAFGDSNEEWNLLYSQGNFIYATETRIAKIARTQDEEWVEHGLKVALYAGANKIKAVQPLVNSIVDTDLGKATLWPRVTHRRVDVSTINENEAIEMGEQIALISKLNYGKSRQWDPFHRLNHRIMITKFPVDVALEVEWLVGLVSEVIPSNLLDYNKFVFAHSDAHVGNMLFNEDGINIIDFDSANWYPVGWDMAFLFNHIVLENKNNAFAYLALKEGYLGAGGILSDDSETLYTAA